MRRSLVTVLTALALGAGVLVAAQPAAAGAFTTALGPLTPTTGRVAGTVTTDAPHVEVSVRDADDIGRAGLLVVPDHPGGPLEFDLTTWGVDVLDGRGVVSVLACSAPPSPSSGTCDAPVTATFTAADVAPDVSWPADDRVGPSEAYPITVSDPSGGGSLWAMWEGGSQVRWQALSTSQPTEVDLHADGQDDLVLHRCAGSVEGQPVPPCRELTRRQLTVNQRVFVASPYLGVPINPATRALRVPVDLDEPGPVPVDVQWHVRDAEGTTVGPSGSRTGLVTDAEGRFLLEVDVSGLTTGSYVLRGAVTAHSTEWGDLTGTLSSGFEVDTTRPVIDRAHKSATSLYPYRDGYRDLVRFTLWPAQHDGLDRASLEIVNGHGAVVRRVPLLAPSQWEYVGSWNGRNSAGAPVGAGTYTLRGRLTDRAGNTSTRAAGTVTVVRKKLAARSLARTVRAGGSMFDEQVGACSTIRRPALRGWTGSLGLYSNTRCARGFNPSSVASLHVTRLPAAAKYGYVRVSAYGGASTQRPGSLAYITYLDRRGDWVAHTRLGARLGNHAGARRLAAPVRQDGSWLVWSAYTAQGARYDVKSFTVRLNYWVLVAE